MLPIEGADLGFKLALVWIATCTSPKPLSSDARPVTKKPRRRSVLEHHYDDPDHDDGNDDQNYGQHLAIKADPAFSVSTCHAPYLLDCGSSSRRLPLIAEAPMSDADDESLEGVGALFRPELSPIAKTGRDILVSSVTTLLDGHFASGLGLATKGLLAFAAWRKEKRQQVYLAGFQERLLEMAVTDEEPDWEALEDYEAIFQTIDGLRKAKCSSRVAAAYGRLGAQYLKSPLDSFFRKAVGILDAVTHAEAEALHTLAEAVSRVPAGEIIGMSCKPVDDQWFISLHAVPYIARPAALDGWSLRVPFDGKQWEPLAQLLSQHGFCSMSDSPVSDGTIMTLSRSVTVPIADARRLERLLRPLPPMAP